MPVDDLLFVHPLLGVDDAWSGYLVETATADSACANALAQLRNNPTVREFDHRHPWLIAAALDSGDAGQIENVVHLFQNPVAANLKALEERLRKAHGKLGLIVNPGDKLPMTGTWDYLLISSSHARTLPPYTLIGQASRTVVIATEVHSHADYAWGQSNACSLATTEFLATRNASGKRADMTRVKLLKILALIAEDADTGALEEVFREEPKLSYSLLRLVNTAAIAPRTPITSFAQAINLLGRRQLQRWLQLLVYADPNNGHHPNPLLQKAAARGRLMELLAPALAPPALVDNLEDSAFMIGSFSLLNVLLNMSMSEILQQLPLADVVHQALAEHAGPLGKLLLAIDSCESRDHKTAAGYLQEMSLSGESFLDAQLSAFSWAAKIRPTP
jgi:EAL and modified HD-GYP domain-containing signal transduction protein